MKIGFSYLMKHNFSSSVMICCHLPCLMAGTFRLPETLPCFFNARARALEEWSGNGVMWGSTRSSSHLRFILARLLGFLDVLTWQGRGQHPVRLHKHNNNKRTQFRHSIQSQREGVKNADEPIGVGGRQLLFINRARHRFRHTTWRHVKDKSPIFIIVEKFGLTACAKQHNRLPHHNNQLVFTGT